MHGRDALRNHHNGACISLFLFVNPSWYSTRQVWDLHSGHCLHTLLRPNSTYPSLPSRGLLTAVEDFHWCRQVTAMHLDPHRSRLSVAHHDGTICVWQLTSSSDRRRPVLLRSLRVEGDSTTGAVVRCLSGDAWHLVCGCDDQTIKVSQL